MAIFGEIPSTGYNPARVMLDPSDPDYLKKLGIIGAVEGQHELNAPAAAPAMNANADGTVTPDATKQSLTPPAPESVPSMTGLPTMSQHDIQYQQTMNKKPAIQNLWDKTNDIQSKPARILGKIGVGALGAGEALGESLFPRVAAKIPGSLVNTEQQKQIAFGREQEEEKNRLAEEATQAKQTTAGGAEEKGEAAMIKATTPPAPKAKTLNQLQAGWADKLSDQINPATGQKYTPQEALKAVSLPPEMQKQVHDAFTEWQADPKHKDGTYDDFLNDTANIKSKGSVGRAIALSRIMALGYNNDPRLLQAMPEMLKEFGLDASGVQGPPAGQPVNTQGQPIGLHSPEAPTGTTRTSAQTADRVLTEIPNIRQSIKQVDLGPITGRWNEFVTGKVGAGDPKYEALRTNLAFLNAAAAKFHLNSVKAVEEFDNLAQAGKMTPEVLNAYVDTVENWAKTASKQGKGVSSPTSGEQRTYQGKTYTLKPGTDRTKKENWVVQ